MSRLPLTSIFTAIFGACSPQPEPVPVPTPQLEPPAAPITAPTTAAPLAAQALKAYLEDSEGHSITKAELQAVRTELEAALAEASCDTHLLRLATVFALLDCEPHWPSTPGDGCGDARAHIDRWNTCAPQARKGLNEELWEVKITSGLEGALVYAQIQGEHRADGDEWLGYQTSLLYEQERHQEVLDYGQRIRASLGDNTVGHKRVLEYMGRAAKALGRIEEAESYFQQAIDIVAGSEHLDEQVFAPCPHLALGTMYREQGRAQDALGVFVEGSALPGETREMTLDAMRMALEVQDFETALLMHERSLEFLPEVQHHAQLKNIENNITSAHFGRTEPSCAAQLDAGVAAFDDMRIREAQALARMGSSHCEDPRLEVLAAWTVLLMGDRQLARERLRALETDHPQLASIPVGLAHVAVADQDRDETTAQLQRAESLLAEQGTASSASWSGLVLRMHQLARGWSAANHGNHSSALASFDEVLAANPDDRLGLLAAGNSHIALGDLDRAQALLEQAQSLYPNDKHAKAGLGLVYYHRGDNERSAEMFRGALSTEPLSYTCPHEGLGMVYLREGDTERAQEHFERAIEINPDIEYEKYNGLARIHMSAGRYSKAETLLRKSIENYPHDNEATQLLEELGALQSGAVKH